MRWTRHCKRLNSMLRDVRRTWEQMDWAWKDIYETDIRRDRTNLERDETDMERI